MAQSELVRGSAALSDSERVFRMLVEGVVDYAIFMLDPDGRVATWNPGAERMKGYLADEIIGQHFSRFYPNDDREAGLPAEVLETARREGRFEGEGWRLRKDGSRFWASVVIDAIRNPAGNVIGFAKITRDITERRAAHDALRERERQFRLLVDGVREYALYMLDPEGVVTSWNAGAERIKGYTSEEVIGRHFSMFYTEEDRAAGLPSRALETARDEGVLEIEGWRQRKDGSLIWVNAIIHAIRGEQGELVGFAKITRDLTEKRNAELALREAQIQRDRAQRMEMLGQLTGGVAHDFNNLLMVISGQIRALKGVAGNNPRTKRAADAIETAAQQGAALTRQLLTFSRRQSLNPEMIDLRERLTAFREFVSRTLGTGIQIELDVSADLWPVKADASELELTLVNLALNARDAMPSGGTLTIAARNREGAKLSSGGQGDFVDLRITDTGTGIAPDILPRVFEPFFTTKHPNKGSGLGLSQVHGFAHQSGGAAAIESTLGKGTTVKVFLPRAEPQAQAAEIEISVDHSGRGDVLLVEDNPDVAEVSAELLQQLGYHVKIEADAQSALDRLKTYKPKLVVTDIVMAGEMDGLGLARTIRKDYPQTPVLLVTGYSSAAEGASDEFVVLRKPFSNSELGRAASEAMRQLNIASSN